MGFNISGMVIDNNFNKSLDEFEDAMHWGLEVLEEINFEQASANWTPDDIVNIYFSEKATMIFYPFEWSLEPNHPQNVNSLGFAYSETVMTFAVSYLDSVGNYRFFIENEGERQMETGNPLLLETEYSTADGLIFKLFDVLLDESFFSIDVSKKAYRCKKVPYNHNKLMPKETISVSTTLAEEQALPKESKEDAKLSNLEVIDPLIEYVNPIIEKEEKKIDKSLEMTPPKKWWEFWK